MADDKLGKIIIEIETFKKLKVFELLEKGYSQASQGSWGKPVDN